MMPLQRRVHSFVRRHPLIFFHSRTHLGMEWGVKFRLPMDLDNMINTVGNLQGEWTGMAQIDYSNMFDQQVPSMRTNLAELLENLIQAMRRAADVFERADQEAV